MRLFNKFNFALHSIFTLLPYPTSILYSYWTSQPDKRITFGSLKQGKHLHHFYNTISTIYDVSTGLLSLIEEQILSAWSKENIHTTAICYK